MKGTLILSFMAFVVFEKLQTKDHPGVKVKLVFWKAVLQCLRKLMLINKFVRCNFQILFSMIVS